MKEKQAKTAKKRAIRGPVIHPVETSKTTPLKKELEELLLNLSIWT